jgi:alkylation response protein AidB-like acyl-CoA dehydrogenase
MQNIRLEARKFADKKIEPRIVECVEKYEFPDFIKPQLLKSTFFKALWDRVFSFDSRATMKGIILAEMARGDAGVALYLAHSLVLG